MNFLITIIVFNLLLSCIPIFTGEGNEVKKIQPFNLTESPDTVIPAPVPGLIEVKLAEKLRTCEGQIGFCKKRRKLPLNFVRICIFDSLDQEISCSTSNQHGRYKLEFRAKDGNYRLSTINKEFKLSSSVFFSSNKNYKVDLIQNIQDCSPI
ncbi:MAG: hypothetical protein AB8G05_06880 [Oligoflexales bacterium]